MRNRAVAAARGPCRWMIDTKQPVTGRCKCQPAPLAFDKSAVDDVPAFRGKALFFQLLIETVEQFPFEPELLKIVDEVPDRFRVRHRLGEAQAEEITERNSVTNMQFGLLVGKIRLVP